MSNLELRSPTERQCSDELMRVPVAFHDWIYSQQTRLVAVDISKGAVSRPTAFRPALGNKLRLVIDPAALQMLCVLTGWLDRQQ
jgi:hypothetical protein